MAHLKQNYNMTMQRSVMILTGVWCMITYYLVNCSFLVMQLRRIADRVLPFVLIGLGIYIMIEAFSVQTMAN